MSSPASNKAIPIRRLKETDAASEDLFRKLQTSQAALLDAQRQVKSGSNFFNV